MLAKEIESTLPGVDDRDSASLNVRLLCANGGFINFGPLRRDGLSADSYDFLAGPINVVDTAGTAYTLDDRSGIEALTLGHFRSDLRTLLEQGHGLVFFGDHDFSQIAELEVVRPEVVRVTSNLASLDLFDIAVGELALLSLRDVVNQIDRVESALGPLIGYCEGCGPSSTSYTAKAL